MSQKNLEKQFKKTLNLVTKEIDKKLAIACKALNEAEKLAEENGIPFDSPISPIGQLYNPSSCQEKWKNLKSLESILEDLNLDSEYNIEGWQHSDIC